MVLKFFKLTYSPLTMQFLGVMFSKDASAGKLSKPRRAELVHSSKPATKLNSFHLRAEVLDCISNRSKCLVRRM